MGERECLEDAKRSQCGQSSVLQLDAAEELISFCTQVTAWPWLPSTVPNSGVSLP